MPPGYVTHCAIASAVPFRCAVDDTQSDELITSKQANSVSVGHLFVVSCRAWKDGNATDEVTSRQRARMAFLENMLECWGELLGDLGEVLICRLPFDVVLRFNDGRVG